MALPGFHAEESAGPTIERYRVCSVFGGLATGLLIPQQFELDEVLDEFETLDDSDDDIAVPVADDEDEVEDILDEAG